MISKKPKILIVASELTPLAKIGGLGDVVGALPQALKKENIDARIVIPRYEQIKTAGLEVELKNIPIEFGKVKEKITLYKTKLQGVIVYLINNPTYLSKGPIYADTSAFVDSINEIERFLFFSVSIVQTLPHLNFKPDILHCHDWHTAIIPNLLNLHDSPLETTKNTKKPKDSILIKIGKEMASVASVAKNYINPFELIRKKEYEIIPKTLLTIHNLANQGNFSKKKVLAFLGLTEKDLNIHGNEKNINIFKLGIQNADLLNTVSKTYSKEILTKEFGEGLEKTLISRKDDLSGILNGIDMIRFNPAKDENITDKYSAANVNTRKPTNKNSLKKELGLDMESDGPLFCVVSRLTDQKGIDLVAKITETIVKADGQLVFLGQGAKDIENLLIKAQEKYPEHIQGKIGFDAKLAQRMYAGADIFLMPSRFEPCGLGQMIAMRYGAIPIVRATGGLKDSVKNLPANSRKLQAVKATGFVFEKNTPEELKQTIEKTIDIYKNNHHLWQVIQKNGMTTDFSWNESAKKYVKLYKKLLK